MNGSNFALRIITISFQFPPPSVIVIFFISFIIVQEYQHQSKKSLLVLFDFVGVLEGFLDHVRRTGEFGSNGARLFLRIGHGGIDSVFILLQEIFQKRVVQEFGTPGLGQKGPQEKGELEGVVKGNPVQQKVGKDLNDRKEGKNDPIDQPLCVVSLDLCFDGLKGLEGGVDKSNNAAKGTCSDTEKDKDGQQQTAAKDHVLLGHFYGVLQFVRMGGGM